MLHLQELGEGTLAGGIYKEQVARGWPGLAKEAADICKELGIENVNETKLSKNDFKQLTNLACLAKNEQLLREMAQNKTKCKLILKEPCGKKLYMEKENIAEVRKYFKARTNM